MPEASAAGFVKPIRVVICDDHPLARAGLVAMLSIHADVEVAGEAADGREGIRLCQQLAPDIVLMDLQMPGMDGLTAMREIKLQCPRTSTIILTGNPDSDSLFEAIKLGAAGYLQKGATGQEMIAALRRVVGGGSLLDADLAAQLLQRLAREQTPLPQALAEPLTPRECDVLGLVAKGLSNQKIGAVLFISLGTVKSHVEHVIGKLGVSDRTQAAVRAIELGIISLDSGPRPER